MAIDCQGCDERLLELIYGELDDVSAAAMRRHLEACARCAAEVDRLRQTREIFSQLEAEEPAPVLDDAIMQAARAAASRAATRSAAAEAAPARPAPAAREPEAPGWLERLVAGLRAMAAQPAFVTAMVVVVVGAVGYFFLRDRQGPAAGSLDRERLVMVPESELRARRGGLEPPAEPSAPRTVPAVPAPVQPVVVDEEPSEPAAPEPPPPAERPARTRAPERDAIGTSGEAERAHHETTAALRRADGAAPAFAAPSPRPSPAVSGGDMAPLVLDAQPVDRLPPAPPAEPAPARPAPTPVPRAWPGGVPGGGGAATPPLPVAPAAGAPAPARDLEQQQDFGGQPEARLVAPPPARAGRALYDRGMEAYRARRWGDAADELSAFVQSPSAPRDLVPSGIHHLAKSYRSMGNLAAAARHYDDLLRRFPSYGSRGQALLEAAQVQARLGNYARASSLLSELEGTPGYADRARRERAAMDQRRLGIEGAAAPAAAEDAAEDAPAEALDSDF